MQRRKKVVDIITIDHGEHDAGGEEEEEEEEEEENQTQIHDPAF